MGPFLRLFIPFPLQLDFRISHKSSVVDVCRRVSTHVTQESNEAYHDILEYAVAQQKCG